MLKNKKAHGGTGGGPYKRCSFSALEETTIQILSLHDAVEGMPIGCHGLAETNEEVPNNMEQDLEIAHAVPSTLTSSPVVPSTSAPVLPSSTRRREKLRIELLKDQVDCQKQTFDSICQTLTSIDKKQYDIVHELRKISRLKQKTYDLEKEKFTFKKEQAREKLKIRKEKLELEKKKIELKFLNLN